MNQSALRKDLALHLEFSRLEKQEQIREANTVPFGATILGLPGLALSIVLETGSLPAPRDACAGGGADLSDGVRSWF